VRERKERKREERERKRRREERGRKGVYPSGLSSLHQSGRSTWRWREGLCLNVLNCCQHTKNYLFFPHLKTLFCGLGLTVNFS
jgi:hypothetical protein